MACLSLDATAADDAVDDDDDYYYYYYYYYYCYCCYYLSLDRQPVYAEQVQPVDTEAESLLQYIATFNDLMTAWEISSMTTVTLSYVSRVIAPVHRYVQLLDDWGISSMTTVTLSYVSRVIAPVHRYVQ